MGEPEEVRIPRNIAEVLIYRADQNAKNIGALQEWRSNTDRELERLTTQIEFLAKAVVDVETAIKSVGTRLVAFALTVAAAAIGIALTVYFSSPHS